MAVEIDIRAGSDYAFAVTPEVEDGGETHTIRLAFRWLRRLGRWVVLPTTPSTHEPLGIQQVVGPQSRLLLDTRQPDIPPGRFVFVGPDAYTRTDLGETMRLIYLTSDEVSDG